MSTLTLLLIRLAFLAVLWLFVITAVGRLIRIVGYIAVAATLLVGIPWASIRYVGWPLPTSDSAARVAGARPR